MKKLKNLNNILLEKIKNEIKILLHASRDCMRNQKKDTLTIRFSSIDYWYSEALGLLRGLVLLNYGYFGSSNLDATTEFKRMMIKKKPMRKEQNFKWLMTELEKEILKEEGFSTDHRCEYCLKTFGKDDKTIINEKRSIK